MFSIELIPTEAEEHQNPRNTDVRTVNNFRIQGCQLQESPIALAL